MFDFLNPYMLWIKIAGVVLALGGAAAGGAYITHRIDDGKYQKLVAADATSYALGVKAAAADQHSRDAISMKAATHDAAVQPKIVDHYITLTKEIPSHVQDTAHCITFGFVRVLNAGAAGAQADPVPDSAGQPDDACAPVSWRDLASQLTADYQAGTQNSAQLTDLQNWVKDQEAANSGVTAVSPAP